MAESAPFAVSAGQLLSEASATPATSAGDAVILLDENRFVFDPDGRRTETNRLVYRILTARGVEDWADVDKYWEPWHQKRPMIRARVVSGDGTTHELDPKIITDGPANGDGNRFSDARVVRAPLPAIAVGSVVEEETVTEDTAPEFAAGVVTRVVMARPVAVAAIRLTLEYPATLPFHYATYLLPDVKAAKDVVSGIVHLKFEVASLEPAPAIPVMLPFDVPRWPHVIFSTGTSWSGVAREYNRLVERQINGAPVADLVKRVTAGKHAAASREERLQVISALLRALHTEVRYTGVEFGEAAIVPAKPADTLQRKYGDCKDKAALLVSMLRTAGIPSYVALLSSGTGMDVDPGQPGMGLFNHAIVYVPGPEDLWIDATAEYLDLGATPSGDQDRLALIVREETTDLTKIPESASSLNRVTETREFFLPDFGKARVVETTEASGESDEWYRSEFGSADTDQVRKNLGGYMRNYYVSEDAVKIEHPSGVDFSKPFHLRLEISGASRGTVTELEAAVGLTIRRLIDRLPAYFTTEEDKGPSGPDGKPKLARTQDFVLPAPFVTELQYKVVLPPGYQAKKIPADKKMSMGPALFTSEYHVNATTATAVLKFDTVKRRYSAEEAAELRKAVLEFTSAPMNLMVFEPIGQGDLEAGRVGEAIAQFGAMSKQFPDKALYHVQRALALLAAGCGENARHEAELATKIEPGSATAWQNLGFVRIHDLIGRQFRPGFDSEGAEAAYRKTLSIDPRNLTGMRNLSVLLEYDAGGRRYALVPRLNKAIEVLRAMGDDLATQGMTDNLLYDLAYAGRDKELLAELDKLGLSSVHSALRVVAATAVEGSAAAIATADKEGVDSAALQSAALIMQARRMYPQAADLLIAGARGSQKSAELIGRANAIRNVRLFEPEHMKTNSASELVTGFFGALYSPDATREYLASLFSKESTGTDSVSTVGKQIDQARKKARSSITRSGINQRVMADLIATLMQTSEEPNGEDGFRVRITIPGVNKINYYVVTEQGKLKVLGSKDSPEAIGRRVLGDVKQGKLAEARRWLDWMREEIPLEGGEDPLSGPAFPRLWTKNSQAAEPAINEAAAALIGMSSSSKEALPQLRDFMRLASEETKWAAELAFVRASLLAHSEDDALAPALSLCSRYPDSPLARQMLLRVYMEKEDWKTVEALAQKRLAAEPNDAETIRMLAQAFGQQGKFLEAESLFANLAKSNEGSDIDWNQFGWNALLAGDITADKVLEVQRDATAHPNLASLLHTLASMYAETGKTAEARELVLSAMEAWGVDEPNSESWYVFGRIAEQFGVRDAAISDYSRVERPETARISRESTYAIARGRIALLKAGH